MYSDRTRGGRPTGCAVDLDEVRVTDAYEVLYKGSPPLEGTKIGQGAYGRVFRLSYFTDSAKLTLKQQNMDDEVLESMRVAESLRDCALVDFKSMNIEDLEIWTLMEAMDRDCSKMQYARRRRTAEDYAAFLRRLRDCLFRQNASFTDMKLNNTAVKRCGRKDAFRLIDLDGINAEISTLPAIAKYATECETPEEKRIQTSYAFAVTAMLYEKRPNASRPFYWNGLAPLRERIRLLQTHMDTTPTPGVASLIADALKAVEAL